MKFVYPYMLVLVALVPIAGAFWVYLRLRAQKRLAAMVAPSLQTRLVPQRPHLFNVQALLLLTGMFLMVFAAARPQWGHSMQVMQARTRNVVVALDVSRSMLAEDVRPNRLERAKADVSDLIGSLEGDRCALVAFRRTGVLLCPLTTDHAFLRSALEAASPESAPRGETDLGAAIRTSLDALDPAADDHNAIILISDGGDLRGGAIEAAQTAAKRNVPVFTVGLGNPKSESTIPGLDGTGFQQYQGASVKTKLDEAPLREIAKASGGRYVPLATAGTAETTLGAIYRRFLRQVAAKEQAEEEELRATERFGVFLVPGLLLILVAAFFSHGRFAGRRVRTVAAVLALSFTVIAEESESAAVLSADKEAVVNSAVNTEDAAVPSANVGLTDGEVWNIGVDAYREGNYTNALSVLRPLMLSKTHGVRASEVVGALQVANRDRLAAEDPAGACAAAEDAAAAFQTVLRANPDDPRVNRNFTRAVDTLANLRESAHVAKVLKDTQNQQPDQLIGNAVKTARCIFADQKSVLTNSAPAMLKRSEEMSRQMEKLADVWIPVKQMIMQSVTNEQQAANIVGDVEASRDATRKAADELADLDSAAAVSLSTVENALTRFWKMTVMPPAAIDEDILAQTNAYIAAETINNRPWQREALAFTAAFRQKFPMWAQQYEQQAQADTNKPPFTKEAQAEINALSGEVEKMQLDCCKTELPPKQLEILTKLERIRELLPKDKNGGGQNNQQQQNNQNQDQQNQQQNQDKQDQDKDQDNQDQNQQDQQQDNQQQQNDKQDQKDSSDEQQSDQEVEAMLQKAQERNDEHENAKKARMKKIPPSPNERDW